MRRFVDHKWQYQLVNDLERRAIDQHERIYAPKDCEYITKVVYRDAKGWPGNVARGKAGCGACARGGRRRRSYRLAKISCSAQLSDSIGGPAFRSGVQRGDALIGINGVAFIETEPPNSESLVKHAVSAIQTGEDPVVLHLQRPLQQQQRQSDILRTPPPPAVVYQQISAATPSLLDMTTDLFSEDGDEANSRLFDVSASDLSSSQATPVLTNSYKQHIPSFVRLLATRGVIHTQTDEMEAADAKQDFRFRARQWEDMLSFQIPSAGVYIPLTGVRKALSVRIVNTFQDGADAAYTV